MFNCFSTRCLSKQMDIVQIQRGISSCFLGASGMRVYLYWTARFDWFHSAHWAEKLESIKSLRLSIHLSYYRLKTGSARLSVGGGVLFKSNRCQLITNKFTRFKEHSVYLQAVYLPVLVWTSTYLTEVAWIKTSVFPFIDTRTSPRIWCPTNWHRRRSSCSSASVLWE